MILLSYGANGSKALVQCEPHDAELNIAFWRLAGGQVRVCPFNALSLADPAVPDTIEEFDLKFPGCEP